MCDFCHLHLHTEYSLLDGLNRVETLIEKVKADGMESVAVTDHGIMYGIPEFWFAAKDANIKPIIGCEIYLSPGAMQIRKDIDGIKNYHLLVLAKNFQGYQNLNKLVSIAQQEGYYYKPRVDRETLAKYSEGLIITSACLAGPLSRHILRDQESKAREWLEFFKSTFKDDFYLEVQRNGFINDNISQEELSKIPSEYAKTIELQSRVNLKLREFADEYSLPILATTDAHYLNKEDRDTQEILFAIKDGRQISDENRRLGYLDTYVKTQAEMKDHFSDMPEALENTMKLSEKIENYDIAFDRVQPKYHTASQNKDSKQILREYVEEGAKTKYEKVDKDLMDRINYELEVIDQKGYNDYFLVVSDIMNWSRQNGIVVGVRGSVAGSVAAYCLGIINVEPIGWELYFERFLNPDRPSPPDIDMDIQDDRRDEVIRYVEEQYGKENVVAICAIGRMKTKAAIRDVARVMGIDLTIADRLSKKVHVVFGKVKKIKEMMKDDQEFAQIVNSSASLLKLKANVEKIEGMARHVSTHACGYLITPKPIVEYVSIQKETKGGEKFITQNEGAWIEALGLMKFDFLGLRNLTIIKNTLDFVKKYHNVDIKIEEIPLDDKPTFDLFARGETIGVFQFEGPAMQKYLKQLKPENLEDLCFMVSAYRPGPMQYIPDYIKRKHGFQKTTYLIPEMEPILKNTYGFAIYQEQIIKIAVEIAGYTMGQADLLRRAMGKKKMEIMKKEESKFKDGVRASGFNNEVADELWNYLLPFADYGFNKAHGAGYAVVAYWCAYLKAHYPIEFMAGLLHSDISDTDRIVIDMKECQKMNIDILPPDIDKSELYFTIEDQVAIRFGMGAIKNASEKSIEEIVRERKENGPFENIDDLIRRVKTKNLNKKTLECLVKVGTMDKWGNRNQLLAIIPSIWERTAKMESQMQNGQSDIFGMFSKDKEVKNEATPLPQLKEETTIEKITWEKELIGTYVTEHPLRNYQQITFQGKIKSIPYAKELAENTQVEILCIITNFRSLTTKTGKPMAFLQLEDTEDSCESIIFSTRYIMLREKVKEFLPMIIKGRTNFRDDKLSLIIDDIYPADEILNNFKLEKIIIDIRGENDPENIKMLKAVIASSPGKMPLEIIYGSTTMEKRIIKNVDPKPDLISIVSQYKR